MDVDDLADSIEQISLTGPRRRCTFQLPVLDDELETMSVEEADAGREVVASAATSDESTQPMLDDEEQSSATSSRATSSGHHRARRKLTDNPPLRRGGSQQRKRHALTVEVVSIARGLVAPLLALALGNADVGTGAAALAAAAQVLALVGLAGCRLRRRRKRMMDWERNDGMVCRPRYWWITEVDGVVARWAVWAMLLLLRVAVLAVCLGVVWMRFDEEWAMTVRAELQTTVGRCVRWMLSVGEFRKRFLTSGEDDEVLSRMFFDAVEVCPGRDWATLFEVPACDGGFR